MKDHLCDILFAALYLVLASCCVTMIIVAVGYMGPFLAVGSTIGTFFTVLAALSGMMGGAFFLVLMGSHLFELDKK